MQEYHTSPTQLVLRFKDCSSLLSVVDARVPHIPRTTHPPHNWCFGSQRVYFTTVCCRRACKSTTPSPTELLLRFKDCSSLLCAVDVLARAGTSKVLCGRSKLDQHHLLNIALCSTVSHLSYCDGKYWSIWHGQLKRPMYK